MSKRMVFNRADGGVSIAGSNDKAISAMTGEGGLVAASDVERCITTAVTVDGIPESIARANFEGKAFGGMTEDAAMEALIAYHAQGIRVSVGAVTSYHWCEDADVPTDRYFRNAWTWSD